MSAQLIALGDLSQALSRLEQAETRVEQAEMTVESLEKERDRERKNLEEFVKVVIA